MTEREEQQIELRARILLSEVALKIATLLMLGVIFAAFALIFL